MNESPVLSLTVTTPNKGSQQSGNKISSVIKVDGPVDPNFSLHSKTIVSVDDKNKGADAKTSCKNVNDTCCVDQSNFLKNRFKAFDLTAINLERRSNLPYVEPKAENYQPMPYMFRIPGVELHGSFLHQPIRSPPFYILLDHTIAVVWTLYSKETTSKPLGINQLQWALVFLQNVKNDEGIMSKDVAHCINTISDELIEQYAEIASDTQFKKNMKRRGKKKTKKMTPLAESSGLESDSPGGSFKDFGEESVDKSMTIQREVPFSVTYADMALRSPPLINIQTSTPFPKQTNSDVEKSKMMDYLGEQRKDQMKKIYYELERLQSIEKFMGCTTDENADSKIQALLNEKSKQMK